jgi:hypothetical protein
MPRISIDKQEVIKLLEIEETLDELLEFHGARMHSISPTEILIHTHTALPESVQSLAIRVDVTVPSMPINILGSSKPVEMQTLSADYEYTFSSDHYKVLKGLLYLASEKQRFEAFSRSIDTEIEEELGKKQQ